MYYVEILYAFRSVDALQLTLTSIESFYCKNLSKRTQFATTRSQRQTFLPSLDPAPIELSFCTLIQLQLE